MSDVSMAMIQSAAFHEMPAMQTCTVRALWGKLKESIDSTWLVVSFTFRTTTTVRFLKLFWYIEK